MSNKTNTTNATTGSPETSAGAVLSFDPATDPAAVHLAPAAARHLSQSLQKNAAVAVRLGVTESGCNGYMYELSYATSIDSTDHRYEFALEHAADTKTTSVTVVVSRQDLPLVQGTEIDYVTEGLNSALKFANPNADTHCGCGESFSVSAPTDA